MDPKDIRVLKVAHWWSSIPEVELSNEQKPKGWLGFIGDDELPSFIGIVISHYKDPY